MVDLTLVLFEALNAAFICSTSLKTKNRKGPSFNWSGVFDTKVFLHDNQSVTDYGHYYAEGVTLLTELDKKSGWMEETSHVKQPWNLVRYNRRFS